MWYSDGVSSINIDFMNNADDLLPILTNHWILESIVMKSISPVSIEQFSRLIPAACLYSFIQFNKKLKSDKFFRLYLKRMYLCSFARKMLTNNDYPGCDFITQE
jgi:hypothetical protein